MKTQLEMAGLGLHCALDAIAFDAMLTYKHGHEHTLLAARKKMVNAIENIDRTLEAIKAMK